MGKTSAVSGEEVFHLTMLKVLFSSVYRIPIKFICANVGATQNKNNKAYFFIG
jgi:hypothetical protein